MNASTANGTAAAGSDYVALVSTPVTFPAGSTSQTVSVTVNGDTVAEASETLNVTLSGATNATIGDGTAQGTITNDDGVPGLAIDDVAVTEGATHRRTFTVTLVGGQRPAGQCRLRHGQRARPTAGTDYTATSGTLNFAPGTTTPRPSPCRSVDDTLDEGDETFTGQPVQPDQRHASPTPPASRHHHQTTTPAPTLTIGDVTGRRGRRRRRRP